MNLMSVWESLRTPAAFLFVLGVLVFVHEFGHFLVARWHGVRVITFSLGFGPKLLRFRRGDTEYCVSAVPLGGYVKLAGETVEEDRTGAPDEFLSKSKWVRFQVYLAGPIMNLVLAWIVLAGVLYQGAEVPIADSSPAVVGALEKGGPGERAGLHIGDRILAVNGRPVPNWEELNVEVLPKGNQQIDVFLERSGQRMTIKATPAAVGKYEIGSLGIGPLVRPQVAEITHPGAAGDRAGVRVDDIVLTVDGERLDQPAVLERMKASPGKTLALTVEREGRPVELSLTPENRDGVGFVGLRILPWEFRRIEPTVLQAFGLSWQQNKANTVLIGRTLKGLFARETPVKQLMGPIAIGSMAGSAAQIGWLAIFQLMAMLSLNLGLLNLMPVPVLDGGHIAILAVEGAARRDLSVRVKERILMVGAALIVLLMVTVIYNDIVRLFK